MCFKAFMFLCIPRMFITRSVDFQSTDLSSWLEDSYASYKICCNLFVSDDERH